MIKTQIHAEIVGHSLSPQGDELISVLCTFPRIILAEVNTHRMLSKNTSSSRAIPFKKMVEAVKQNPFIPIAWQKEHKGMQGSEYLSDFNSGLAQEEWLKARDNAIIQATILNKGSKLPNAEGGLNVTKQLCNRLLEPFMWTTMLITGSKEGWDNFFNLRCPQYRVGGKGDIRSSTKLYKSKKEAIKDYPNSFDEPDINWMYWNEGQAEIHLMDLAEKIYDALNKGIPRQLKAGEWHIPFINTIEFNMAKWNFIPKKADDLFAVKISTAMAARTSYTVVGEEKGMDYKKMIELHDRLIAQKPPHSSPLEHCARAMTDAEYNSFIKGEFDINYADMVSDDFKTIDGGSNLGSYGWCNNLKGFIPYRYIIDNKKE